MKTEQKKEAQKREAHRQEGQIQDGQNQRRPVPRTLGCGGFTLVELIVVVVIMGILTAAILPTVTGYVATAREQVSRSNRHMVEQAARLYLTDQELEGGVEALTVTASELAQKGYLSPLPEGEDYTVSIARDGDHYTVTVEPK